MSRVATTEPQSPQLGSLFPLPRRCSGTAFVFVGSPQVRSLFPFPRHCSCAAFVLVGGRALNIFLHFYCRPSPLSGLPQPAARSPGSSAAAVLPALPPCDTAVGRSKEALLQAQGRAPPSSPPLWQGLHTEGQFVNYVRIHTSERLFCCHIGPMALAHLFQWKAQEKEDSVCARARSNSDLAPVRSERNKALLADCYEAVLCSTP